MLPLKHKEVLLVPASVEDSEFILSLRLDPELNKYLSQTSVDIEAQKRWLEGYKVREQNNLEFYFIINLRNEQVGTIRIYNIDYQNKTCTWGSFIIKKGISKNPDNPRVSVISLFLIFQFIFSELKMKKVAFDVRKENIHIRNFYLKFANLVKEDDLDTFLELTKEDYEKKFLTKFNTDIF